jgi:nucleoside-diphosphate-sugar epimerase
MRVVVTGAGGFIGRHLVAALRRRPGIDRLVLVDIGFPGPAEDDPRIERIIGDISDPAVLAGLFEARIDSLFHLAAALTAEAERDFDRGCAVNLGGLLGLLEACRAQPGAPLRLVFSSSMASFGPPLPEVVDDTTHQHPASSYGTQKVIAELLLDDYSRRGFLDGRALRLPVVLLRPAGGPPALSELISAAVREPLLGRDVVCPLAPDTVLPVVSVDTVAASLIQLHDLPAEALGARRALNLPGLRITLGAMAEAARGRAGAAAGRVDWRPDPGVQGLMASMPRGFTSARSRALGIGGDAAFDTVLNDFLASYGPRNSAAIPP